MAAPQPERASARRFATAGHPASRRSRRASLGWALLGGALACDGGAAVGRLDPILQPGAVDLDFGAVFLGGVGRRALELTNVGEGPLVLRSVSLEGDLSFRVAATAFPVVPAGAGLEVPLELRPSGTATVGARVIVESDAPNLPRLVATLRGHGRAPPDCADENPCTEERFDPEAGECRRTPREGPCDDGSACTEADVCLDSICRGRAIECSAQSDCTQALCDPGRGCVLIPDDAACDDQEPCTVDRCDAAAGCQHADLPDGTVCGPGVQCVTGRICFFGGCREVPVPAGFPCSDGESCTEDDVCQDQRCMGRRVVRDPTLVGRAETFGFAGDPRDPADRPHAILPGGRLVFADGDHGARSPRRLSVVERRGGDLALVGSSTVAGVPYELAFIQGRHVLARVLDPATSARSLEIFEVGAAGRARRLASLPNGQTGALAVGPEAAYACVQGQLLVLDLADPAAPLWLPSAGLAPGCTRPLVDRRRQRLLVNTALGLEVHTLVDPLHPALLFMVPLSLTSIGDLVGVAPEPLGDRVVELEQLTPVDQGGDGSTKLAGGSVVLSFTAGVVSAEDWTGLQATGLGGLFLGCGAAGGVVSSSVAIIGCGPAPRVLAVDRAASPALHELRGAAQGSLSLLPAEGLAVSGDALHVFQITAGGRPQLLASAGLSAWPALADLGSTAALAGSDFLEDPAVLFLAAGEHGYLDALDPFRPVPQGSVGVAASLVARLDPAGRWLYGWIEPQRFEVHDLALLSPDSPLPLVGSWLDTAPLHVQRGVFLAVDPVLPQVLVVQHGEAELAPGVEVAELTWIDVSDPTAPARRGELRLADRLLRAAAIAGQSAVALEWSPAEWASQSGAGLLHVFSLTSTGAVRLTHSSTVAQATHVLAFDGQTVQLATQRGLLVLDTTHSPPRYRRELPLPERPLSARALGEWLLLASRTALSVVRPACPP